MKEAIKIIKEEAEKRALNVIKILLFGSRAKGTFTKNSDRDFFVIVNRRMNFAEKWDIIDDIKIKLAKLNIPNDIILKSQDEIEESKDDVGRITFYVLREGVEL